MKKIPFFLPFAACAGRCVYCDQRAITGQASLPSPDAVRAALHKLDSPAEVCFFGGSFCRFPIDTVKHYLDAVKECAPAGSRIRFSTYPGDLDAPEMHTLVASYPIGGIELGIPSLDQAVLRACGRDTLPGAICDSLAILRDTGMPLGVQMMIGLPEQTPRSSLQDLRTLAEIKGPQDWDLRLYPCLVVKGTELQSMMEKNRYKPLTVEEAAHWGGEFLDRAVSYGFRPIRVGLQETESLSREICGGPHHPALGELIFSDATARRLARAHPAGPWTVPACDRSKFTGHGGFGTRCLAMHAGIDAKKTNALLRFF